MTISSLLNFGGPAPRGRGSATGGGNSGSALLQPSRTLCVYGGTAAGAQCLRLSESIFIINRLSIQNPAIQHKRTAEVYSKQSEARDGQEVTTGKDATLLAQPRSGHSIFSSKHTNICWTNQPTPTCPRYRGTSLTGVLVGLPLNCTRHRMEIFGTAEQLRLSTLTAFPGKSVALKRRTL